MANFCSIKKAFWWCTKLSQRARIFNFSLELFFACIGNMLMKLESLENYIEIDMRGNFHGWTISESIFLSMKADSFMFSLWVCNSLILEALNKHISVLSLNLRLNLLSCTHRVEISIWRKMHETRSNDDKEH